MNKKKCRCGVEFEQFNSMQSTCIPCAIEKGQRNRKKAQERALRKAKRDYNQETRSRREALKTRKDYIKDLQVVFNAYIRERDREQPCISCGLYPKAQDHLTGGAWDCGHYRSVGSCPELRFEPLNAHRQCKKCNRDLSGNIVGYRNHLKYRIGQEKLEWLEGPHEALKLDVDQLKELIKYYRKLTRELKTNSPGGHVPNTVKLC